MSETQKVRVSRRIQEFLEGSQAWADVRSNKDGHPDDGDSMSLVRKIMAASDAKDGSVTVELTFDEAKSLYGYTDVMTIGARDNAEFGDPSTTAEMNSGRALMAKLEKLFGPKVATLG